MDINFVIYNCRRANHNNKTTGKENGLLKEQNKLEHNLSQTNNIAVPADKSDDITMDDDHEEEFYYNELEIMNDDEIEVINHCSPISLTTNGSAALSSSSSAVSSLSPTPSSPVNLLSSSSILNSHFNHQSHINSSLTIEQRTRAQPSQSPPPKSNKPASPAANINQSYVGNIIGNSQTNLVPIQNNELANSDGPIDLSAKSTQNASTVSNVSPINNGVLSGINSLHSGAILPTITTNTTTSIAPVSGPITNNSSAAAIGVAAAAAAAAAAAISNHISIIPPRMFHFLSTSPSSSSCSSSSSSCSSSSSTSAYFSSSSPTSSTKSWSAQYEIISHNNSNHNIGNIDDNNRINANSMIMQYDSHMTPIGSSVATTTPNTKPIVVLNHKYSNVIKYGRAESMIVDSTLNSLNSHNHTPHHPLQQSQSHPINPEKPIQLLRKEEKQLEKSSNSSVLPNHSSAVNRTNTSTHQTSVNGLTNNSGCGSSNNANGMVNGPSEKGIQSKNQLPPPAQPVSVLPRRRGRPPGSTNKKKKLLLQQQHQQQQLICAMNPLNGTPFIASIASSLAPNGGGPPSLAEFSPGDKGASSLFHEHHSHKHHPLFGSLKGLVAAAVASNHHHSHHHHPHNPFTNGILGSANAVSPFGPVPVPGVVASNRRPRGESRKCRKVYGMDNRQLWCTQCKWKKACSRFID